MFGHTRADNPRIVPAVELRPDDVVLNCEEGGVAFHRDWIVKKVILKEEPRNELRIEREWWDTDKEGPCYDFHLNVNRPVLVELSEEAS